MDDGRGKPLSDDVRVVLFHCTRELVINVVKHAKASKVKVSTRKSRAEVRISVEDDGVGFDPSESRFQAHGGGFGLFSIRERMVRLGGRMKLQSEPGRGTVATLAVPLKLRGQIPRRD